jgi:hypothetical protein
VSQDDTPAADDNDGRERVFAYRPGAHPVPGVPECPMDITQAREMDATPVVLRAGPRRLRPVELEGYTARRSEDVW